MCCSGFPRSYRFRRSHHHWSQHHLLCSLMYHPRLSRAVHVSGGTTPLLMCSQTEETVPVCFHHITTTHPVAQGDVEVMSMVLVEVSCKRAKEYYAHLGLANGQKSWVSSVLHVPW